MNTYTTGLLVILGFIIYGVISHFVSLLGDEKKIGYTKILVISLLTSPVIGLLFVIGSTKDVKTRDEIIEEIKNDKLNILKCQILSDKLREIPKFEETLNKTK